MVVEDGTGLADALAYASVADADAYFAARGVVTWAGDENAKQAALVRATDYIDVRWAPLASGRKFKAEQGLQWPRCKEGLPASLKRACFEYAAIALTTELAPAPKVDDSGVTTIVTKQQVGPLVKEFGAVGGDAAVRNIKRFRDYPIADAMMQSVVGGSFGQREVYR